MKITFQNLSVGYICNLFGFSRQAYYKARADQASASIADMLVLTLVKQVREDIPGLGVRKILFVITPEFERHNIKIGRDHLFDLMRWYGLLIRRRKRMIRTTDSFHRFRKYKNLMQDIQLTGPEQLWVSDITYIKTGDGYSYLSLVTDAYSRKIMGYSLYPTLEAAGCLEALEMAIKNRKHLSTKNLVHHSDRGIQYCCNAYINLLNQDLIDISMTQTGNPYDNALAERMNETIKYDYCPKRMYPTHDEAATDMHRIIQSYNERRPHQSIDYLTPEQAHQMEGEIQKRWKKYNRRKSKNSNKIASTETLNK